MVFSRTVSLLLARGADVNAKSTDGVTPLMQAAGAYEVDVMQTVLDHGADIHAVDDNGWTALLHAVANRCSASKALLMLLRNANTMNDVRWQALLLAVSMQCPRVLSHILAYGVPVRAPHSGTPHVVTSSKLLLLLLLSSLKLVCASVTLLQHAFHLAEALLKSYGDESSPFADGVSDAIDGAVGAVAFLRRRHGLHLYRVNYVKQGRRE